MVRNMDHDKVLVATDGSEPAERAVSHAVRERPDLHTKSGFIKYFHSYHLAGDSTRSFHGVGPSLSWEASAPFAGNPDTARSS